jgi:hypothetical protein
MTRCSRDEVDEWPALTSTPRLSVRPSYNAKLVDIYNSYYKVASGAPSALAQLTSSNDAATVIGDVYGFDDVCARGDASAVVQIVFPVDGTLRVEYGTIETLALLGSIGIAVRPRSSRLASAMAGGA